MTQSADDANRRACEDAYREIARINEELKNASIATTFAQLDVSRIQKRASAAIAKRRYHWHLRLQLGRLTVTVAWKKPSIELTAEQRRALRERLAALGPREPEARA